jgi:type II secretory pathway component PulF
MKALVEAGVAMGDLGRQFERLAAHYDEALKLRREVIAQLVYPAALILLVVATLFFLSFIVLPQFEGIFATSDAKPPPETRFVLAAGAAIRHYWPYAPAVLLALYAAARFAARRYSRRWEELNLSLPVAGAVFRNAEYGAYFGTLAAFIGGGAPLARAMPLAREAMSFGLLRTEVEEAERSVRVGERLSRSLRAAVFCPRELISFVEIGEETGELAAMAAQAASRAESLVRSFVQRSMALLAPAMTALLGLLTAGVIAAVMTGVMSLNEAIY